MASTYLKGFHWGSKAWYNQNLDRKDNEVDYVMFGVYEQHDGQGEEPKEMCCEMKMQWIALKNESDVPRLQMYDDSWVLMAHFGELFRELAWVYHGRTITPEKFTEILTEFGFTDLTDKVAPVKKEEFITIELPKTLADELMKIGHKIIIK